MTKKSTSTPPKTPVMVPKINSAERGVIKGDVPRMRNPPPPPNKKA